MEVLSNQRYWSVSPPHTHTLLSSNKNGLSVACLSLPSRITSSRQSLNICLTSLIPVWDITAFHSVSHLAESLDFPHFCKNHCFLLSLMSAHEREQTTFSLILIVKYSLVVYNLQMKIYIVALWWWKVTDFRCPYKVFKARGIQWFCVEVPW